MHDIKHWRMTLEKGHVPGERMDLRSNSGIPLGSALGLGLRKSTRRVRVKKMNKMITFLTKICLLVTILLQLCSDCKGDIDLPSFTPTLFRLGSNFWRIHEDEPEGSQITEIRPARDSGSNSNMTYFVEAHHFGADISDHFRVTNRGRGFARILLDKSFQGQVGKEYIVRVVGEVKGSTLRTAVEVRVRIERPTEYPEDPNPVPPKITVPLLPPGSITPSPPPDLDNFSIGPVVTASPSSPDIPSSSSSSSSPSSIASEETTKSQSQSQDSTSPQDIPSPFPPHIPPYSRNNLTSESDGKASTSTSRYNIPPTNDPLDQDKKDYPPFGGNEIGGENALAGKANQNQTGVRNGLPHQKEEDEDGSMALVTTIPIVAILAIVMITAAIFYLVNKRSKIKKRPVKEARKESAVTISSNNTLSGEGEPPTALQQWVGKRAQSNRYESWAPDAVPTQARDHWEFPRHHLQIGGILGEGCFGQVWRCEALNIDGKEGTSTVAVKTLKESAGDRERQDLLSELTVMKMLDPHPNVVRLLGCCTDKDPIFVIMEYVSLGKLQSYLRSSRASHYYGNLHGDSTSLSSKDLTSFCYQAARGMEYLASKGIIHRDLAARNILIDKERVCKIADFGFAKDIADNHVYERKSDGRLPIRWMATEALYDNLFTTKTDVWSFGVLMWEIVTLGSTPYPGMAAAEVMRKVRDGYRLEKPEHCRRELYNIMFYCWAHNPDDRPSFSDLVNFLSHLLFSETDYIELDRFPDHDYYNMASLSGEKL